MEKSWKCVLEFPVYGPIMMLNFCFRRDYNTIRARRKSDKSTATDIKITMTINQLKRNHSFKHRWKNDLYVDFLRKESVKRYISDFIWDFGKLPFPEHLGKCFITIGKISPKI